MLPALAAISAAVLVITALLGLPCSVARASGSLPLSPNLYPAHTRVSALDPLSNVEMDCDWSFDCADNQPLTTAPVFHLHTQDELHRLSGWAQFGDRPGKTSRMLFALYASRYAAGDEQGLPWNVAAFSDFRAVLISDGYRDLNHFPALPPRGDVGNSSAQQMRSPNGDVLAMSCWVGSIEVEGVAVYSHQSIAQRTLAMRDLSRQIRSAVGEMLRKE
jgi:hypothetical protein